MKPAMRMLVIGAVCAAAGLAGGALIMRPRTPRPDPAAPVVAPADAASGRPGALDLAMLERLGVRFAPVRSASSSLAIDMVGMLELDRTRLAEVSTHAAGRIVFLGARVGQHVRVGDVLARVESPAIGEAAANFRVHGAELHSAQQQLRRLRPLRDQGLTTQREIEVAEAAVRSAEASQQADRMRLRAYGVSPSHLGGDAPLVSPIVGEVIRSSVVLGSWLQPESEAFVIADLSTLWANIDIPESDLGVIRVGDPVTLDVPATGQRDVQGRVEHIYAEVDTATRMGRVRVAVPNPGERLRAGLSLTAHIRPAGNVGVLHVSSESVRRCDAGTCVLLRREGQVSWVPVMTGVRSAAGVEITSGLHDGDEIAIAGLGLLGVN
ncbi:MAG: efflux RND transporter periplasmic adaptor subunit [Deltaproteobacteria bacterium]